MGSIALYAIMAFMALVIAVEYVQRRTRDKDVTAAILRLGNEAKVQREAHDNVADFIAESFGLTCEMGRESDEFGYFPVIASPRKFARWKHVEETTKEGWAYEGEDSMEGGSD